MTNINPFRWKPRLAIGLDFGTGNSGLSFASFDDPQSLINEFREWPDIRTAAAKTPTSLLYRCQEDGSCNLISWGMTALYDLASIPENERKNYYLIRGFKLALRDRPSLDKVIHSRDRKFSLRQLISDILRKLKEYAFDRIVVLKEGIYDKADIRWCVTVPALWTKEAQEIMRYAAADAGLIDQEYIEQDPEGRLWLCPEPVAAALTCRRKPELSDLLNPNVRFMVVDAGAGTIDLACYEVMSDKTLGSLGEFQLITGNDAGSFTIDNAFRSLAVERLGINPEDVQNMEGSAWLDFMQAWEQKKVNFKPLNPGDRYLVDLPFGRELKSFFKQHSQSPLDNLSNQQNGYSDGIELSLEDMNQLFKASIERVLKEAERAFVDQMEKRCDFILLVGGYGSSPVLETALNKHFEGKVKRPSIRPEFADAAIVRGAVEFALHPEVLSVLHSTVSLGQECWRTFEDEDKERMKTPVWINEKAYCSERLELFIQAGSKIYTNKPTSKEFAVYTPVRHINGESFEHPVSVKFYLSPKPKPRYNEEGEALQTIMPVVRFNADGCGKLCVSFSVNPITQTYSIDLFDTAANKQVWKTLEGYLPCSFFFGDT